MSILLLTGKMKNKNRRSPRLSKWDYSSSGKYFITICTDNSYHFFGNITNGIMHLSEIGKVVHKYWLEIPDHFLHVQLDEFVIMPNHLHGIIIIDNPVSADADFVRTGHALSLRHNKPRKPRSPGKNTISAMAGSFKSAVSKWCKENKHSFGWQSRFHDHILRDINELQRIRDYIINNPANWDMDNKNKKDLWDI